MNTPLVSGATNCASLYDIDLRTRATFPETRFFSDDEERRIMRSAAATVALARRSSAGLIPSAEMISDALALSSGTFRDRFAAFVLRMYAENTTDVHQWQPLD